MSTTTPSTESIVVAATIIMEASGEGENGMLAVAEVLRNRTAQRVQSDGTALSTCLWPLAFSGWNARDPNRLRSLRLIGQGSILFDQALAAWKRAMLERTDTVKGATHYYAPAAMVPAGSVPDWIAEMKLVAVVGSQRFYRRAA